MKRRSEYGWVDRQHPVAAAACDMCARVFKRTALQWELVWAGTSLRRTQFLVCDECLDWPNPQGQKTPPIYGDPKPVQNPRPMQPLGSLPDLVYDVSRSALAGIEYVTDERDVAVRAVPFEE